MHEAQLSAMASLQQQQQQQAAWLKLLDSAVPSASPSPGDEPTQSSAAAAESMHGLRSALAGLREFLASGDGTATEPFVQHILEMCRVLLENEMPLLEPLLGVLAVCGRQFSPCLEPYFVDIVDLLLGWALDPEHPEGDRRLIVESFLKFQPMWARSPQFPLTLMNNFLGDMEKIAQDHTPPMLQQLHRLLALASCFVAVMQATALGLEAASSKPFSSSTTQPSLADFPLAFETEQHMDRMDYMVGSAKGMLPRVITCFKTLGQKFQNFRWLNEALRCLQLFAEVLKESFAEFYIPVLNILFQSLGIDVERQVWKEVASVGLTLAPAPAALNVQQVQVILQVNMRMIACQRHKFPVKAVSKLLGCSSPFLILRHHPSRAVRGAVAATFMLLLQHDSDEVATEARRNLMEELESFKEKKFGTFQDSWSQKDSRIEPELDVSSISEQGVAEREVNALFRFNLMLLLCRSFLTGTSALVVSSVPQRYELPFTDKRVNSLIPRLIELKHLILEKLNPFQDPLQWDPNLQLVLWQALLLNCTIGSFADLHHLHMVNECQQDRIDHEAIFEGSSADPSYLCITSNVSGINNEIDLSVIVCLALDSHASLPLKLEALDWISRCLISKSTSRSGIDNQESANKINEGHSFIAKLPELLLAMAFDRELRVRAGVAAVLEIILQTKLVKPSQFQFVALMALKQLKDLDPCLQGVFQRVAWAYAPAALWMHGWSILTAKEQVFLSCHSEVSKLHALRRKQTLSELRLGQHLRPQQLSWILNYLSQRSQVLPSHWLQRMIYNFPGKSKVAGVKSDGEEQEALADGRVESLDGECCNGESEVLENWSCNSISALWWAVQEASQHCVTVRLRTHLGGPTQTFAALERMLLDVPHLCRIDFGRREAVSGGMASPTNIQLLPLRLLLEFVESLRKDIYNAYEGSVVLQPAPTLSALFFRANRKVCEDWFARIREAFINASVATQCHAGTFLHAALQLQDLRAVASQSLRETRSQHSTESNPSMRGNIQGDLHKIMQHASLALCRAHEADALSGIKVWVKSAFVPQVADDYSKSSTLIGPFAWLDGLSFQARGQYEKAVAEYKNILHLDEALGMMGADGIQFAIARTIESYVALADWESLDSWVQELQHLRVKHAGKPYCGALTTSGNDMNPIYALARFDEGDVQGALNFLDLTPQNRSELTADPWQALQRSEQMLLQAMLQVKSKPEKNSSEISVARAMIEDGCQVALLDGLEQAAPFLVQLDCIRVYETFRNTDHPEELFANSPLPLYPYFSWPLDHMHQDCQPWLKLLRVYRVMCPGMPRTLQLYQQLMRLARKQSNLRLARRLSQEFQGSYVASIEAGQKHSLQQSMLSRRFIYEDILLNHAETNHEDAILNLWQFVENEISACLESSRTKLNVDPTSAKACLKLASWLRGSCFQPSPSLVAKLGLDSDYRERDSSSFGIGLQQVEGAAIKGATLLCPDMAKTWFTYGYWCFFYAEGSANGTKVASGSLCSFLNLLDDELGAKECDLNDKEVARIHDLVSELVANSRTENVRQSVFEDANDVENCVQQIVSAFKVVAASAGSEDVDGDPPPYLLSLQLQRQLQIISSARSVASVIPELMGIWWALRRRRVTLFHYSAKGFLQYLALSNHRRLKGCFSEQVKPEKEDCMLSASLYLLRILVNYGVELEDSLQQGLSSVPPSSWQAISAQILARLSSHPESRVRKQLEGLLMTSAISSPWAIVYPLLVDMNASDGETSEELKDLQDCLVKLHPKLARDVKSLLDELGGITVFWDEQWLSTLQDLRTDVMRRITALKHDAARVAENATLSLSEKIRINAAKYLAMMAPVVVALERRLASTSWQPETPHQAWFQEQFGSPLKTAIEMFKAPPANSASLSGVWRPFDTIMADLVSHQKKSSVLLSDVSPALTALQSSEAPMPGLGVHSSVVARGPTESSIKEDSSVIIDSSLGITTVASFSKHLTVLSTKTKPKKLQIVGSDGGLYTYLLKGREDLRLDARIMQLLQAVNSMLLVHSETRIRGLTVRHYSVTPISGRAGLIQWVDDLTSMYSVYKAWQERTLMASGTNVTQGVSVPRPSDLFYGKIIPALKEKGLRKVISRRDWPQDVKRNVLLELVKETPRQLLHNELWCASEGLSAFMGKLDQFSGSVAVISIVGYILGLGDRHLDNILVDFSSGDVVHIDYNVCFDKGLRLKIPEIVPFRLTHTIQAALGLTGVEGVFRRNCESVLKVLQSNKEVLLMLLQVFVWDPLVEWMRGDGHDEAVIGGEERKGMELAVSLSLFASRLQEIRVPLQEHHDQLLMTLPAASFALESLVEAVDRLEQCYVTYAQAEKSRRAAVHTEGVTKSLFVEATSDLEKAQKMFSVQAQELDNTKLLVIESARTLIQWVKQHVSVLDALRSGSVPELESIGKVASPAESLSLKSALLMAGVPLSVIPEPTQVLFQEIDQDVTRLTAARHEALLHAVQSLHAYSAALQQLVPVNYISSSHVHSWAEVLQRQHSSQLKSMVECSPCEEDLLAFSRIRNGMLKLCHLKVLSQELSPDALAVTRRRAADLIAQCHGVQDEFVQQKYNELHLHFEHLVQELQKLKGNLTALEVINNPEAVRKAKDLFLTTVSGHLQSVGKDCQNQEVREMRSKYMLVLQDAAMSLYEANSEQMKMLHHHFVKLSGAFDRVEVGSIEDSKSLEDLKEVVDKYVFLLDTMSELGKVVSKASTGLKIGYPGWIHLRTSTGLQWAVKFTEYVAGVGEFHKRMTGTAIPKAISATTSHDPGMMEAFTAFSQIRETVDRILQHEMESVSHHLRNCDVGDRKHGQVLMGSAATVEMDQFSWEDTHLVVGKRESSAQKNIHAYVSLDAIEQRFKTLVDVNSDLEPHIIRGKVLLADVAQLFSGLERWDQGLTSFLLEIRGNQSVDLIFYLEPGVPNNSGNIWRVPRLSQDKAFFVWKVRVMDALLDLCIRDVSAFEDLTLTSEQVRLLEKKLGGMLQWYIGQYLGYRFLPVLLLLVKETHPLKARPGSSEGIEDIDEWKREEDESEGALRLLHEYCKVHDTVRAANAASSALRSQAEELMLALDKVHMEAARMEWCNELVLSSLLHHKQFIGVPKSMRGDKQGIDIAWWNRQQVCKNLYTASTAIRQATEELQGREMAAMSAEGELERAVASAWASFPTAAQMSGVPPEFHDHLRTRRQLLRSSHEQSFNILRYSEAVLKFESSRDGFLSISPGGGRDLLQSSKDRGRIWQKKYFDVVSRLESAYMSLTNLKMERQSAMRRLESAKVNLSRVANELQSASSDAESTLGAVKVSHTNLKAQMKEAATCISALNNILRNHSSLTLDAGQMLEEVLVITEGAEGADDVHTLAQEASTEHAWLMAMLSKVNELVLPLEPLLTSGAPLANILSRLSAPGSLLTEGMVDRNPGYIHNILDQNHLSLKSTSSTLAETVPGLLVAVRHLHSCLSKLIGTASSDAGFLHKALAGVGGDGQEESSQQVVIAVSNSHEELSQSSLDGKTTLRSGHDLDASLQFRDEISVLQVTDDCWISPPDSGHSDRYSDSLIINASCLGRMQKGSREERSPHRHHHTDSSEGLSTDSSYGGARPVASDDLELSSSPASSITSNSVRSQRSLESCVEQTLTVSTIDGKMEHHGGVDTGSEELPRLSHQWKMGKARMEKLPLSAPSIFTDTAHNSHVFKGKNAHAVSVLKRVQMKLEGQEVDGNRQHSVTEQVDVLLRQATGIDSLSNMYEGWTPWV